MPKQNNDHLLYVTNRPDIVMVQGNGTYLWDQNGDKYLDFIGGWAVTCLGHCPPSLVDAITKQANLLINASPAFYNRPMLDLADLLIDISCFDRAFFASSGAEANEGAIKLARKFGAVEKNGAYEIITTVNSFHGRTLATMSASGKEHWKNLFEPKVPGFLHAPFNDIVAIRKLISAKTCAIMIELIQGEGGVNVADHEYVQDLRRLCDENNLILIVDEIQTGLGRTGKMFAYEDYKIEPDIMTLAKGLGGGFPVSALLAKEKLNIFSAGDQGGTYTGQPLAMAAALSVINTIIKDNILDNVQQQSEYIQEKLQDLAEKYSLTNIRGKGLLLGFDLATPVAGKVAENCLSLKLIINAPQPSSIRLMPPLTVCKKEVDEMLFILEKTLKGNLENEC